MHGYILISNGSHEIRRIEADRVTEGEPKESPRSHSPGRFRHRRHRAGCQRSDIARSRLVVMPQPMRIRLGEWLIAPLPVFDGRQMSTYLRASRLSGS